MTSLYYPAVDSVTVAGGVTEPPSLAVSLSSLAVAGSLLVSSESLAVSADA